MASSEREEQEIDLKELLLFLLGRWGMILITGILFAAAAFFVTQLLIAPKYTSTTSLYVINRQDESQITSADLNSSATLTADFEVLITSRTVLEQVIETIGLDISAEELENKISVDTASGTRILEVSVQDENAYAAKRIADAVAEISAAQMVALMGIDQVNIIDYGNIPTSPSSPNLMRNVIMGGVIGVVLTVLIFVLIFIFDDTLKTAEDVEDFLGISVLGAIPINDLDRSEKNRHKRKGVLQQKKQHAR